MKTKINVLLAALLTLGAASCSKEDPFPGPDDNTTGKFATGALKVSLQNDETGKEFNLPATRAGETDVNNFTVGFYKDGETEPVKSYTYGEMPEVVELPVGTYSARASYGENPSAAWDAPYFQGSSENFEIKADEITDDIDPIVCKLSNVRVTIVFDPLLTAAMSPDSKVTVQVGESGTLEFTKADENRSGYFAYVEGSQTLAATFEGKVEGYDSKETKARDNVEPGHHYRITFRLHTFDEGVEGDADADVNVDASVEDVDMNVSVDFDDETVEDDMRPVEGGDEPGPGPVEPGVGGPSVEPVPPVSFDQTIEVTDGLVCKFKITSETGITALTVDIVSDTLTPGTLTDVGLTDHLDLVNPGSFADALSDLGFPVNVGGQKDLDFDISDFMPMLSALGGGTHKFVITATDANGTTKKTLTLHTN